MKHVHVLASGTVQAVGYRASCYQEATRLGIGGWVRNLTDGRVEAEFHGPEEAVAQLVQWCRQGPASAVVGDVTVEEIADDPGHRDRPEPGAFVIR